MQYEKQVFTNGQVLTAECLNRMEEGIKGACEAVPPTCDSADCSKVLSYGPNGLEWIDKPTGGGGSGANDEAIAQMQKDIADLKYVPIDITQITGGKTVEMGSVVTEVTIGWTLNKEPASQTIDGESVDVSARTKVFDGLALSANRTFTLAVTDERDATDSASTTISFLNGVYYGVLEQGVSLDSTAILTLTRKLQGAKGITFTANAGATQQIAYALPTRYGTPNFNVGGFDGGFAKVKTFDFTNASGCAESYDVWLSENVGLGSTTVKVS